MLGKRPRPNNFLRKTTSKSQLLSYGNSNNKDSPQQVVVGFKLAIEAAEKRRTNPNSDINSIPNSIPNHNPNCNPYQACESPKSVLELCTAPKHSSSCRHSHRAALRSPRSVLGTLLISAGNPVPAGIGLGIVVAIKAEEIAAEEAEAEAAKLINDESELSRSKLVSLKSDPISIMVSGLCNSKKNSDEGSHSFREEEEDDDDEMKAEIRSNIHRKINDDEEEEQEQEEDEEESEDFSLNLERKMIKEEVEVVNDEEEEEEEEEDDDDDETEMERMRESIFSTASPAATNNFCGSSHGSFHGSTHFLSFCCLCKRPLSQGRDIFMYRGDLGFCSAECRYQQIVVDDRKERMLSSSSSTTPNCYAMHNHTLPATATARAAVA